MNPIQEASQHVKVHFCSFFLVGSECFWQWGWMSSCQCFSWFEELYISSLMVGAGRTCAGALVGSSLMRWASLLTAWVWISDRCVWFIPVVLVAWLMIRESFDFLLTESEMRTDSAPEFPQQEPTLAVPSFTTWCQECVHLYPQVPEDLYMLHCLFVQPQGFKESGVRLSPRHRSLVFEMLSSKELDPWHHGVYLLVVSRQGDLWSLVWATRGVSSAYL